MNGDSRFSWRRAGLVVGAAVLASGATLLAVRAYAAGIPATNALTYTGYLETPDGKPVTSAVNLDVYVWSAAAAGSKVCEVSVGNVTPVAGRFQVSLPDACTTAVKGSPNLWLELRVDGSSLGRSKLGAVPYAVEAAHATNADSAAKADSATTADKAAAASGALATQLTGLQTSIDGVKSPLLGAGIKQYTYAKPDKVVTTTSWTWISGTPSATLKKGRYWVYNTATFNSSGDCSNCKTWSAAVVAACSRVDGVLNPSGAELTGEAVHENGLLLPVTAMDYFDFAADTAKVELGLCAKRVAVDATIASPHFHQVYSVISAEPN